jgi:ribosomal protein S18 acetylase RimI-like enzyme
MVSRFKTNENIRSRNDFKNIMPISFEIFEFLGDKEDLMQMLRLGNREYSKKFMGEVCELNFIYPNKVFIAKKENKVIGFIRYQIANEEMSNIRIAVDYNNIERGVSDELIQECIKTAKELKVRQIRARIFKKNFLGKNLFERNGFKVDLISVYGYVMYEAILKNK